MQLTVPALLAYILFVTAGYANAYVGPGLAAGTIGVICGIVGSIFIAVFAVLWYPFKRLLKKLKKSKPQNSPR